MLFIGHRFIQSPKFYHISDIANIERTPASSIIYLNFSEDNLDIIQHLQNNAVTFALEIQNIKELLYAAALGASYVTCNATLAKTAQKVAEHYLLDTKILVHVTDEESLEEFALLGIDGVIFAAGIIKVS